MLRDTYGPRIGPGPLGDMFRLLTAEPIRTSDRYRALAAGNESGGVVAGRPEGAGVAGTPAREPAVYALIFLPGGYALL